MGLIEQLITLQNLAKGYDCLEQKILEETCPEAEFDLYSEQDKLLDRMAEHVVQMDQTGVLNAALTAFATTAEGQKLVAEYDG